MSKLFKLKEWLTIPETAKHLTGVLSETVTEADIYRLALDGHLTLSVNFVNHAQAYRGKLIPLSKARKVTHFPFPDSAPLILGVRFGDKQVIDFGEEDERNVITIAGVFDLAMIGAEVIDLENRFQILTGGVAVDLINMDGTFVESFNGEEFFSILEELTPQKLDRENGFKITPATYMPANGLPDDSVIVVRTNELNEFIKHMADSSTKCAVFKGRV